jgi:hypothetical protein
MEEQYKMSIGRLARKVQWEGGVLEAVQYGIRAEQIADPELSASWRRIEEMWASLQPAVAAVDGRLGRELARAAGVEH